MVIDALQRLTVQRRGLRYGVAVVAVAIAWAVREAFLPDAADRSPFVVFGLAILTTALVGGLGPGILATALSTIIALLFYLPPTLALAVHAPLDVVLLGLFVLEGAVAALVGGMVHRSLQREHALDLHDSRFATFLARAEALRRDDPPAKLPRPEPLTARELEVARLLAMGLSNDEIAAALVISRNTVKTHLKRVYDKLGARTRTEAVAALVERGLLSGEDKTGREG